MLSRIGIMFLSHVLDVIFPPRCLNCGAYLKSGETICDSCFAAIPVNATLFCGACRARLPYGKRTCHYDFPYLLGAAANYDDPIVKNLIHALKFDGVKRTAAPLAQLLTRYAENVGLVSKNQIVVPVPLGRQRQRARGYNQAAEIAKLFAKSTNLIYEEKNLTRIKNTPPQTEAVSAKERLQNVKDCFAVTDPQKLRDKRVILIDDVTTSGATFLAAAEALKAAGARSVLALAAAKA